MLRSAALGQRQMDASSARKMRTVMNTVIVCASTFGPGLTEASGQVPETIDVHKAVVGLQNVTVSAA
jgi:hypothetical protein